MEAVRFSEKQRRVLRWWQSDAERYDAVICDGAVRSGKTFSMPSGKLIGLDKGYALEQICAGDVLVEYDKLIDRQMERAAITSISGFAKLFTDAGKVLAI